VDTDAREQINLILDLATEMRQAAFGKSIHGIYADRAEKGLLRSGATIKVALESMQESGEAMLSKGIDQVSLIAKDAEAFAMLSSTLESHIAFLETHLDDVLRVSGVQKDGVVMSAAAREARLLFVKVKSNLLRQLEIHRFTFTEPSKPVASTDHLTSSSIVRSSPEKNKGGKPLAKHWDAMWAAMAVKLYTGGLIPRCQADIERAMKDWFATNDRDIGDTTVRGRARALWDAIQSRE